LASSGPRSLRLAGRVADGVLFQVGADPALVRYALRSIAAGAGRDPGSVTRYVRLACSVGADRERVREAAKGYAAVAAGTVFANVPREHVPPDVWEDIRQMKERYDYYEHGSAAAPHTDLLTDRALRCSDVGREKIRASLGELAAPALAVFRDRSACSPSPVAF